MRIRGEMRPVGFARRSILAVVLAAVPLTLERARAGGLDDRPGVAFAADQAGPTSSPRPIEHAIEIPVGDAPEPMLAVTDGEAKARTAAEREDALELELDDRQTSFPDPFEGVNRRTLSLNQTLDRWVIEPVTDAYVYVVPDRAKRSVRDFFANLESPAILVNDVLQGELDNAAVTVARFSVNTVIGLAGLFDPATSMGLERHEADFGQTLARNGFGSGPFLIVPLLGPTTVRDGIGTIVDVALQPTIYLLGPAPLVVASVQEGTDGLTLRAQHGEDLKRLEGASLDYYAALRSAYYQDRMATLAEEPEPGELVVAEETVTAAATPGDAVSSTPQPDDPT